MILLSKIKFLSLVSSTEQFYHWPSSLRIKLFIFMTNHGCILVTLVTTYLSPSREIFSFDLSTITIYIVRSRSTVKNLNKVVGKWYSRSQTDRQ